MRWKEWEKDVVREHYRTKGPKWIAESGLLPDRTYSQITDQAYSLGLHMESGAKAEVLSIGQKMRPREMKPRPVPSFLTMPRPENLVQEE